MSEVGGAFPFMAHFVLCPSIITKFPPVIWILATFLIGFSDLNDLWVSKIKKPMILCTSSMSRWCEQSTKHRRSSENMWKVCLCYSQNNKILWLSNTSNTFDGEIHAVRKSMLAFYSWLCYTGSDWLSRQTPITWTRNVYWKDPEQL